MGMDVTVEIGPYLVMDIREEETTAEVWGCSNCNVEKRGNNVHCNQCGMELGNIQRTYVNSISTPYEYGIDENAFMSWTYGKRVVWFDNQHNIGITICDDDMQEWNKPDELHVVDSQADIEYFEKVNEVYLNQLLEDNVEFEIKWGILSYFM
jgi:hypothetical protein